MATVADLTTPQRDAYATMLGVLRSYDLEALAPVLFGYVQKNYTADYINILLPEEAAYKQRFSANTARKAAGLPVLSPAEYLSTERSYRQVMQAYGLPQGFYDRPSDFEQFLAKDVSPTEVQQRVIAAADRVQRSDPQTRAYFSQWYSQADMVAYALDSSIAAPLVEQRFRSAEAASQANRGGLNLNQQQAELVGQAGLSFSEQQKAMSGVVALSQTGGRLSAIYGGDYDVNAAIGETILDDSGAAKKRKGLASQERGAFGGSSATTAKSLSARQGGQV